MNHWRHGGNLTLEIATCVALTAKLARLLKAFRIIPETIRQPDNSIPKGNKRHLLKRLSLVISRKSRHDSATTPQPA